LGIYRQQVGHLSSTSWASIVNEMGIYRQQVGHLR